MTVPSSASTPLTWRFNCIYDPRAEGCFVSHMCIGRVQPKHLRLDTCFLPIVTWGTRMVSMPPRPPCSSSLWLCNLCVPDLHSSSIDLSKHRRYEIRMSVYNAVGEGPLSPPQEVFVGEAGECTLMSPRYRIQGPHPALAPLPFRSLDP